MAVHNNVTWSCMANAFTTQSAPQAMLEDLKTFYTDRIVELEDRYGKRKVADAIRLGWLDTRYSPTFGEIAYLSLKARRACGFGSLYVPPESAVADHIANREALKMLFAEGYVYKDTPQKYVWQLEQPGGGEVLMTTALQGRLARSVDRLIKDLEKKDVPYKALPILVIHPRPNQLRQLVAYHAGRVTVRLAPWAEHTPPWAEPTNGKKSAGATKSAKVAPAHGEPA